MPELTLRQVVQRIGAKTILNEAKRNEVNPEQLKKGATAALRSLSQMEDPAAKRAYEQFRYQAENKPKPKKSKSNPYDFVGKISKRRQPTNYEKYHSRTYGKMSREDLRDFPKAKAIKRLKKGMLVKRQGSRKKKNLGMYRYKRSKRAILADVRRKAAPENTFTKANWRWYMNPSKYDVKGVDAPPYSSTIQNKRGVKYPSWAAEWIN